MVGHSRAPHRGRDGFGLDSIDAGSLDLAEQRNGKKMSQAIAGREIALEWNAVLIVEVARRATQLVYGQVRIAQAMNALATDWNSKSKFDAVHERVLAVFKS